MAHHGQETSETKSILMELDMARPLQNVIYDRWGFH